MSSHSRISTYRLWKESSQFRSFRRTERFGWRRAITLRLAAFSIPCDRLGTIPPVPETRTATISERHSRIFDELVIDFPFVDSRQDSYTRGATRTLRPCAHQGADAAPFIEKPEPGTGATLLAQVICDICVGYAVASMTEAGNEDEFSTKDPLKTSVGSRRGASGQRPKPAQ